MLDLYVWAWSVKLFHKSRLYDRLSKFSESNDGLDRERERDRKTDLCNFTRLKGQETVKRQ